MFNDTTKTHAALESLGWDHGSKTVRGAIFHAAVWLDILQDVQGQVAAFLKKRGGLSELSALTRLSKTTIVNFPKKTRYPAFQTVMILNAFTSDKPLRANPVVTLTRRYEARRREYERTFIRMEAKFKKDFALMSKKKKKK